MQKNTPSKPAPHSNPARQGRRSISSDEALAGAADEKVNDEPQNQAK